MIAYLKGLLTELHQEAIVLDVQGIGYFIFMPTSSLPSLPPIGSPIHLHTSLVIREQAHTLYGFLERPERDLFNVLIEINGVGPKLALSILGTLTPSSLYRAVESKDIPTLCHIPGVGKKTAERLIVELHNKLLPFSATPSASPLTYSSLDTREAITALVHLGYPQTLAQQTIQLMLSKGNVSGTTDLISAALRHLSIHLVTP